ncbi:hypothetical protein BH24ACT26_BH24ACT26_01830 [soil metagenome]
MVPSGPTRVVARSLDKVSGAGAVAALVLLECTAGLVAAAAWTQSWAVVRRGHFRIVAWTAAGLGLLAVLADGAALEEAGRSGGIERSLLVATASGAVAYLVVQYSRTDVPAIVVGYVTGALGAATLAAHAALIGGWPPMLAAVALIAGAVLVGAVINGMLLGHWYLNQPGLKPWALARLTTLGLVATVASAAVGVVAGTRLAGASTEGAVLGLPGFGASFGAVFYVIWLGLVVFTGVVVWMARRCVSIRSIQSATGLYYVALLTAGVSEFLVRYLMVNAA